VIQKTHLNPTKTQLTLTKMQLKTNRYNIGNANGSTKRNWWWRLKWWIIMISNNNVGFLTRREYNLQTWIRDPTIWSFYTSLITFIKLSCELHIFINLKEDANLASFVDALYIW